MARLLPISRLLRWVVAWLPEALKPKPTHYGLVAEASSQCARLRERCPSQPDPAADTQLLCMPAGVRRRWPGAAQPARPRRRPLPHPCIGGASGAGAVHGEPGDQPRLRPAAGPGGTGTGSSMRAAQLGPPATALDPGQCCEFNCFPANNDLQRSVDLATRPPLSYSATSISAAISGTHKETIAVQCGGDTVQFITLAWQPAPASAGIPAGSASRGR